MKDLLQLGQATFPALPAGNLKLVWQCGHETTTRSAAAEVTALLSVQLIFDFSAPLDVGKESLGKSLGREDLALMYHLAASPFAAGDVLIVNHKV